MAEPGADPLFTELAEALAPHLLLVRLLGSGGMGMVYLARDPSLKRQVAVKVLAPILARDPMARARFAREAEAMAAISHPHIVSVYQVGALPRTGTSYMVMQYVSGGALREAFPPGVPASEARARQCMADIASALAAAHRVGIVHRDIKPGNVMLDKESNRYQVLDFGISAVATSEARSWEHDVVVTAEQTPMGTPLYMSPEQGSGEAVTGKSDVYSLGCVVYELLTGGPPFDDPTPISLIAAHLLTKPAPILAKRPELDPQFAELIDRCLAKAPEARPSAEDILRFLRPSHGAVIEWPPPGLEALWGAGTRWTRTLARPALLSVLFFAALMIQPTVSRACCWAEGESSRLWSVMKYVSFATPIHFDDPDAISVWYFLLDAIFILLLFAFPFVAARSWRLARQLRGARRAGYPWGTVLEVGWDQRSDTADLLNETGDFTLLSDPERDRLLALRRWSSGLLVAAVLLALLAPVVWLYAGGRLAWDSRGPVIGLGDALALWLAAVVALLAALLARVPEWRRFGGGRRLQAPGGPTTQPDVRRELVEVWLRSAGRRSAPDRRVAPAWLLSALPVLLLLALIGTAAVTLSVVFRSTVRMVESGSEGRAWLARDAGPDSLPPEPPNPLAALALDRHGALSYCLNAREVLFGPAPGSDTTRVTGPAHFSWRALSLLGLDGLRERLQRCSEGLGRRVSTVDSVGPSRPKD